MQSALQTKLYHLEYSFLGEWDFHCFELPQLWCWRIQYVSLRLSRDSRWRLWRISFAWKILWRQEQSPPILALYRQPIMDEARTSRGHINFDIALTNHISTLKGLYQMGHLKHKDLKLAIQQLNNVTQMTSSVWVMVSVSQMTIVAMEHMTARMAVMKMV